MDVADYLAKLGYRHGSAPFLGIWTQKHWMNTPGPFYCSSTDNTETGPLAAPNNVGVDREGFEVIFRQPVNQFELSQLIQAAEWDPFQNYGADGNVHWTPQTVRDWWAQRAELIQVLDRMENEQRSLNAGGDSSSIASILRWRGFLANGMSHYLRSYIFLLEHGRKPRDTESIPNLE